jgi:hypothetical protein|tara:strand:+ start:3966 stop:4181 length:216 start_codon:yes stop_codon:yes gene_type:complete
LTQLRKVWFYGDLSEYGYKISYILFNNRIKHDFVYMDDYYMLSIEKVIDITGPNNIIKYLNNYEYVFDLYS